MWLMPYGTFDYTGYRLTFASYWLHLLLSLQGGALESFKKILWANYSNNQPGWIRCMF